MPLDKLIQDHHKDILSLAHKHGAVRISVFGSRARGDARADSDVDLLVAAGPHHSPFFPGGLLMDLQDLLGCSVNMTETEALNNAIRDQIMKEAVAL